MPHRRLARFETVVKTLGGTAAIARRLGISASYVSNWRRVSGKIPSKYYLILREELADAGFEVADGVFNFVQKPRKKRRIGGGEVVCSPPPKGRYLQP